MEDWQAAGAEDVDPALEEYFHFLTSLHQDQAALDAGMTTAHHLLMSL
jgi:hypothetical protein